MMRFIPTILVAFDLDSVKLLTAVRDHIQSHFPLLLHLIQFRVLVAASGELLSDLDTYIAEPATKHSTSSLAQKMMDNLQQEAIHLLSYGLDPATVAEIEQNGIIIQPQRRIYCLATAAESLNQNLVPQFGELLRFLLNKFFTGDTNRLELITLLPSLFADEGRVSCANTYAFLKVLDHHLQQSYQQQSLLFDNHWLIDRTNAENIQMPSFQEGVEIYAESLSIFLIREIEANHIPIGDRIVKGKVAAFSSFGCSEALLPIQEIIKFLWIKLATDILSFAFLQDFENNIEQYRYLLIDAKKFVLKSEFHEAFNEISQPSGRKIWQDFRITINDNDLTIISSLVAKINNQKRQFCEQKLLSFKQEAEDASRTAKSKIQILLESEVKKQLDAEISGLDRTQQFLNTLIDSNITQDIELLNEEPKNLITYKYQLMAELDSVLKVTIDRQESKKWLQKIQDLQFDLENLKNSNINHVNVLITLESSNQNQIQDQEESQTNDFDNTLADDDLFSQLISEELTEDDVPLDNVELTEEELSQSLSLDAQIAKLQEELQAAQQKFRDALRAEELAAQQARKIAIDQKRRELQQNIQQTESLLFQREKDYEQYQEKLDLLLDQQRSIVILYCVKYLVPIIFALVGLGFFLKEFNLLPLLNRIFILSTLSTIFAWGMIFLKKVLAIKQKISQLKRHLKTTKDSLKNTVTQLRDCHNEALRFEFDIYVQRIREDVADDSVKMARQFLLKLGRIREWLNNLNQHLLVKLETIHIPNSLVRSSIISIEDIQSIYEDICASSEDEARNFIHRIIQRSETLETKPTLFQKKLKAYTQEKFNHLQDYSLGAVLNGTQQFKLANDPKVILRKFYRAAQPAIKLFHIDMDQFGINGKDMNLWIDPQIKSNVLASFSEFTSLIVDYPNDDPHSFTLMGRNMGFPAYFISRIEYYRLCYEELVDSIETENRRLEDLLPSEDFYPAWQVVLMAIALDLLIFNGHEYYYQEQSLGRTRRAITESLTREYNQQALLKQLEADVQIMQEKYTISDIYERLLYLSKKQELETFIVCEEEIINNLLHKYDPLN